MNGNLCAGVITVVYLKYFWIYLKYCCTITLGIGFDCKMNGNLCAGVITVVFFIVLFITVMNDILLW